MAQTLLIGLGGTGSRIVNNVVKELRINNIGINNGEMCCAVLDTNVNDNEFIVNSNTGVPVIPTSKAQKIRGYFEDYHHLHMETWCPQSPAFMEETMIDGASELRLKSRIAFMDCIESGDLENMLGLKINEVLKNNAGSKIRVMIVSSLSGGTGSGMFIQVALWLRKFLKESDITIRGIFMLPDVFISTLKDIRDNKTTTVRHYCNAYAAIRELNTISKIKKSGSVDLPEQISIGSLFDSIRDKDTGKPVYDFAFFVDDKNENGVRLESISEYEKMVAQLVYMQLYAPMKDDMYSEEDNAFLSFVANEEPLYGSCGTAKAVYPVNSIKTYCAIRAARDSLTGGWKKIDSEINALIEEQKQRERDGVFSDQAIDIRAEYIRLYDEKISVKPEDAGKDRFFISISKDSKNETKVRGEGDKIHIVYTDKVADFIKLLKGNKIDGVITKHSGTEDYAIDADAFVSAKHTKEELESRVRADESGLEEVLDKFDTKVEEYAEGIVNSVFPYSMGDVKASNRCSVYGLLTKLDEMGEWNFVHPVSARYILYKLVDNMERALKNITVDRSREEALAGGDVGTLFDNPSTSATETDPNAYLNSKKFYQGTEAFLDEFERRYAQFITTKIGLCEKYQKERLQVSVYRKLIERLNGLIKQLETFFKNLDDVEKKLDEELVANVIETEKAPANILYVYGSRTDKEAIYSSLDFEIDRSNVKINKSVIDAIYGRLCAEKRPSNEENKRYTGISVVAAFVSDTIRAFRYKIENDDNNKAIVDIDIYTALCKSGEVKASAAKPANDLDNINVTTGEIKIDDSAMQAQRDTFVQFKKKLHRMAAPFLIHDTELSDDALGTRTTRDKTFWGFNEAVKESCPFIGVVLGVNDDLQAADAYPKNELYCYRAVYGMAAKYVPKFNELNGGMYYTSYKAIVDTMAKDADGRRGERAFVITPHLDKKWHRILPYITDDMQKRDRLLFFRGLWLAIAYGNIKTDKDGNIVVKRSIDGGFGEYTDSYELVTYKNKKLTKTDVAKLIDALKADKVFNAFDIPALEKRFLEELDDMDTYVGTNVLKGLTTKKDDLNPINIVVRYNETPKHDRAISSALIGALESIAEDLAKNYGVERSEDQLKVAKFSICKRIYDSGSRSKGKSEIFSRWEDIFKDCKIKETSASDSDK